MKRNWLMAGCLCLMLAGCNAEATETQDPQVDDQVTENYPGHDGTQDETLGFEAGKYETVLDGSYLVFEADSDVAAYYDASEKCEYTGSFQVSEQKVKIRLTWNKDGDEVFPVKEMEFTIENNTLKNDVMTFTYVNE